MRATSRRDVGRRAGKSHWHWLLLAPMLVPLATPLFNRTEPRLLGFSFFYWSQLALTGFAMVITLAVHVLTKDKR